MQCDGSGLLQVILDDGGDQVPVQVRHCNGVGAGVGPVEVGVDPVDGQAVGGDDVLVDDDFLLVALVDRSPVELNKFDLFGADSEEFVELCLTSEFSNPAFSVQVVHVHFGKEGSQFEYKLKMRHTCLTQQEGYFLIIGIKALI